MINFLTTTKYFRKDSQSRSSLRQPLFRSPFAGVEIEMVLNTINWKKKKEERDKETIEIRGLLQSLRRLVQRDSAINCEETRDAYTHAHDTHARTHAHTTRSYVQSVPISCKVCSLRSTIIQPDKAEAVTYVPVNEGQCGGNRVSSISV